MTLKGVEGNNFELARLHLMGLVIDAILSFRDLSNILSIVAMAWQFLTPVMYGQDMVEEALKIHPILWQIWNLNPMTPLINAYREILYYKQIPDITNLGVALLLGVIVCAIGWVTYGRLQRGFAEEL